MKKIILSFLSLLGFGFATFAQSHINIELLSATYTAPAVQFRVSWSSIPTVTGQIHNSKIWLWVDFVKIENNQPSGSWTRATVANPSPGTVATGTNKGFWLQGNSGSYSQIVTVSLTNIPENTTFNWCAYASDCPPNVTVTNGTYTFKGTPPFTLIASNSSTTQTVSGTTLATSALTITPITIRDKTECPGVFCLYSGSDLYIDATHICQQRTSGAKNWVAWINDARDNKKYRIARLSTGLWTMDDYLNYTAHSAVVSNEKCANADPNAKEYWRHLLATTSSTLCPTGWRLPTEAEYTRTMTDWYTYLLKTYVNTGETMYDANHVAYECQTGYIAFLASNCLAIRCYGLRSTGYNPVTGSQRTCMCYASSHAAHRYSGYARCVRSL
jgi:uncharacterized protein (TIGR02145 family)